VLRLLQHGFEPKVLSAATKKEAKKRYQESGVRAWAGSTETLHSAAPKWRRARGFSDKNSQWHRACLIQRTPVFNSRDCELVSGRRAQAAQTGLGNRLR
jgi:hypothetical protein